MQKSSKKKERIKKARKTRKTRNEKRRQKRASKKNQTQTLVECLKEYLTPQALKEARQIAPRRRPRWDLQPLVFVLLTMTWCAGDSLEERFEAARAFYVVTHAKRRRPGKTVSGLQQALGRLPARVLRMLAAGVRQQIFARMSNRMVTWDWIALGCDGSRIECPRVKQLEERLGQAGNENSAPSLWVTAFVHLRTGLLWSWRLGKGTASEQHHLIHLLRTLPKRSALVVTDAGYSGYALMQSILAQGASFLLRTSSKTSLYVDEHTPLEEFREGVVYYWPKKKQAKQQPPLRLRLIRVRSKKRKNDVWLLTNVLDQEKLTMVMAAHFYRWRWENESLFRTYKQTLKKVKLVCRTVRLVHREAEASLLAVQLLLAHATERLPMPRSEWDAPCKASPRRTLLEIRREIRECPPSPRRASYVERLRQARRESRRRKTPKAVRKWPRRKPHEPPKPPRLLTLTEDQKALKNKTLNAV